jgi:hypothetical protein
MAEEADTASGPFGVYQYPNLADVSADEVRRVFSLHFAYMISPGQPSASDLLTSAAAIDKWLADDALPTPPARRLTVAKE